MAKVRYIVYTEPADNKKGNEIDFFLREWDSETRKGKSLACKQNLDFIIPSMELKNDDADKLLEQCRKDFPQITFKDKYYSTEKKVLWAYIPDKEIICGKNKIELPKIFLKKQTSYSQQIRFFYPPYTIVNIDGEKLILPDKMEKSSINLETIVSDKKCALDIETANYLENYERNKIDREIEELKEKRKEYRKNGLKTEVARINDEITKREDMIKREIISCVTLNFGPNNKKAILTVFDTPFNNYKGYEIIKCSGNKDITSKTNEIIHKEDPLILYGFNIEFDQRKLRELGGEEYLPGVNDTKPVYKSVQGLKNMITKGRFTVDLYGYYFMYKNLFENNKLETHSRMSGIPFTKSLSYDILEYKTKKAIGGSVKDMEDILLYDAEDGNTTFELGEKTIRRIFQNGIFSKRDSSTICTTSGKNIMKEAWQRLFFLKRNTLRNRYEKNIEFDKENNRWRYKKDNFNLESYKDELLKLERKDGLFENVSLVYPLLFIKSFWPMIEGTTDNMRFSTPDEKYNSYQLLNEYICQAVQDFKSYIERIEKNPTKAGMYSYVMKNEFKIDLIGTKTKLEEKTQRFNELLKKAELMNYSKKFLYVNNPAEIIDEGLGFVYGKGNCLFAGNKLASLLENDVLIYQGFGLSRGKKSQFSIDLMRDYLKKRLSMEDESKIIDFMGERINELRELKVSKKKLLVKDIGQKLFAGKSYGFAMNKEIVRDEFLESNEKYDAEKYINNFLESFEDVLYTGFNKKSELEKVFKA